MSIQSEINRIEQNVANTYSVLAEAGAPMPASMDSDNLAGTAANISAVLYNKAQSLTNNQQAQGRNNINAITGSDLTLAIGADGLLYIFAKGVQVGTGIEIAPAGDIIGYVDANNNVVLKGNLADGTYSIKYELEDGSTINIGNLVLDSNTYYTITKNLTNCTINNSATEVVEGGSYSATITANSGYELSSVSVTMGGSAVTVTNGVINIASVTGNIVITAVAEAAGPSYTNLLPQAVDASGNPFVGTNGEDGYKYGYRISQSSGNETATANVYCTGFMPLNSYNDKVYIKNIVLNSTATHNNIVVYNSSKTRITGLVISTENAAVELVDGVYIISINQMTANSDVAWFRFSAGTISDNTIVTVNEPIE